jgi:hypothetical protein
MKVSRTTIINTLNEKNIINTQICCDLCKHKNKESYTYPCSACPSVDYNSGLAIVLPNFKFNAKLIRIYKNLTGLSDNITQIV